MKWGRRENPSFHWTIALSEYGFEILLGLVFFAHLFLAYSLPPAEDELYYWAWSQQFSWSYFDHPPMTAWWIHLSTRLFGNTLMAIRLPAILVHFFVLFKLSTLSENRTIIALLLFTPLSLFGAVLMTPDIPLVLFWLLYFTWASRIYLQLNSDNKSSVVSMGSWLEGGLWLGFGLLSKYTMAIAPFCLGLLLIGKYPVGAWVKGFLSHAFFAAVLFLPVLFFNFQHAFSPFLFQWNHTQQSVPISFLFSYLGSQILLVGALPFLLLPWLAVNFRSIFHNPSYRTQLFFFLLPLFYFLFKSTHNFLEANWGLVSYLSFWPVSSFFLAGRTFRPIIWIALFISFLVPLTASVLITIHLFYPLPWIGINQDRLAKLIGQQALAREVSERQENLKQVPIFLNTYQWTSYFRFYGFASAQQLPDAGRPSHFSLTSTDPCANQTISYFSQKGEQLPKSLDCFPTKKHLRELPLVVRGQAVSTWELLELTRAEGTK